jgi:hypothetical protein
MHSSALGQLQTETAAEESQRGLNTEKSCLDHGISSSGTSALKQLQPAKHTTMGRYAHDMVLAQAVLQQAGVGMSSNGHGCYTVTYQ